MPCYGKDIRLPQSLSSYMDTCAVSDQKPPTSVQGRFRGRSRRIKEEVMWDTPISHKRLPEPEVVHLNVDSYSTELPSFQKMDELSCSQRLTASCCGSLVFGVKKIHPLVNFHSGLWSLVCVMEDPYIPVSWTCKVLQIPVITPQSFLPYRDRPILLCWCKSEVESLQMLYRKMEENTCVWFPNANSGVPLQFGPKSSTRDFLMLRLKVFGAISNTAINQWSFLSCPKGKENRVLNAKFCFLSFGFRNVQIYIL